MPPSENSETKVFVTINNQTLLPGNKMHLNVDAVVLRGSTPVGHKPVIFEVAGKQKQEITSEKGLIENYNLVFDYVEGIRTKLRAWAKGAEQQVSEYDVMPSHSESKQLAEKTEGELSRENAEFLADPKRKAEYIARKARLKNKEQAAGMPTFDECIEAMKKKGNAVLIALRAKAQDPRLIIAVVVGKDGKVKSFRPGLIEANDIPNYLRDDNNPENYVEKHYDKVYADLSQYGLRLPDFDEYWAMCETLHAMGNLSIFKYDNKMGKTILDMEERIDKGAPVPLAFGAEGWGYISAFTASNRRDDRVIRGAYNPGTHFDHLVSRPSVWGDDMPPKT